MAQMRTKFIANDAVTGAKIRLDNNESVRSRNAADNADVELLKLDTSDILQFLTHPQISTNASGDDDVLTLKDLNQELEGLKPKEACRAASTANLTLSGIQTVDGVLLADGDRILVKDQTLAPQNGIYVVAAGAWTRSTDMDATSPINEVNGAYTFIQEGTDNEGKGFVQQGDVTTIGSDDINFVFFNSAANLSGGNGIDITSDVISVDHDGEGLTFNGDQLSIELDGASLAKSGSGLSVADAGITEAKLGSDVDAESFQVATGYTPGAGTVLPGDTVQAAMEKIDGTAAAKQDPISGQDAIDVTSDVVSLTLSAGSTEIAITSNAGTVNIAGSGSEITITDTNTTSIVDNPTAGAGVEYQITDNSAAVWKFTPAFVTNIGGVLALSLSSGITKDDVSKLDFSEFTTRTAVADASVGLDKLGGDSYLDQTDGLKAVVSDDFASAAAGELLDAADIKTAVDAKQDPVSGGDGIDVTSDVISVDLDGATLSLSASGVKVADGGIDEAQLSSNVDAESFDIATGYTPGAANVAVGDTIQEAIQKVEGKVDAVSVPTISREVITLDGTDISNGYVDLAATPLANSVLFEVAGAPTQIEGTDWSLTTNRITFLGDLASGGDAALESGDVIQVTYRS